jgi:hypothetical protein
MAAALGLVAGAGALLAAAALLACLLRLRSPLGFLLAMALIAWTLVVAFTLALSPLRAVRPGATWAWLVVALAGAVFAWLRAGRPRPPLASLGASAREVLREPPVAILAALVAGALAYAVALAVGTPENEGDALAYHLARAAFWHQRHAVGVIGHAVDSRLNVTPPNAEIADLFTMLVSGTQRFAGLVQLGSAVVLALATAGIARRVGLGRPAAAFGGLVLLTLPVVTTQAWTALNDLVVASFLVAAVYFLLGPARLEPALGGLATALAVGTKFTALIALPVVAGVVLAVRGTRGAARLAWPLVTGVAAGSIWYALNLAETGRPDGGLASSASQTPETIGPILGSLHRYAFDVLDLSGSVSSDWRLDHLHGLGGSLYRAVGLAMLVAAGVLALGRRPRAGAIAGAGLLVAAAPSLVALTYSLFARAGRPGGTTTFAAPNVLANAAASWYGPLGAIGLVAGIAVAVGEVRRRTAPRGTLVLALAPVAFALLLAFTIVWDPFRGRFLVFAFALAAASWGLFLRHRWLAWGATAIGAVTVVLALVNAQAKPSGLRVLAAGPTESVWGAPDWWTQSLLRADEDDRTVLELVARNVPPHAAVALAPFQNDFVSPYFGRNLGRHVYLTERREPVDSHAQWLVAAPGVRPLACAADWRVLRVTPEGWLVARRTGVLMTRSASCAQIAP